QIAHGYPAGSLTTGGLWGSGWRSRGLWVTGKIGQRQMGSRSVAQGMPGHPQALPSYHRGWGEMLLPPLGGSLGFCKEKKGFHATSDRRLGQLRGRPLPQFGHRAGRIAQPKLGHLAQSWVELVEVEPRNRLPLAVR